jgi:hypothetical protein
MAPLAQYPLISQLDWKRRRTVGKPRLFDSPYQSPRVSLWEIGAVEWFPVQRLPDDAPRAKNAEASPLRQVALFDVEQGALRLSQRQTSVCFATRR